MDQMAGTEKQNADYRVLGSRKWHVAKKLVAWFLVIVMVLATENLPAFAMVAKAEESTIVTSVKLNTNGTPENIYDDYYEIGTAEELYWFANEVNSGKTKINAVLTNDITVNADLLSNFQYTDFDGRVVNSSDFKVWKSIAINHPYEGIFDGQHHTISGIFGKDSDGLFGNISSDGVVKNVGVMDSYFEDEGGLCGHNCGVIENCYYTGIVSGVGSMGGICGENYYGGKIINCRNTGSIIFDSLTQSGTAGGSVGGICGENYEGTIMNCYNTGKISGKRREGGVTGILNVGGVCGLNERDAIIKNCYNTGTVSFTLVSQYGNGVNIGGICGNNEKYWKVNSIIANCYNVGEVIVGGSDNVVEDYKEGGICGSNSDNIIKNCYYDKSKYLGNAVGDEGETVENTEGKTNYQFQNGAVAYLLSRGCKIDKTVYSGSVWGQTLIGKKAHNTPVLQGAAVYRFTNCKNAPVYTNNKKFANKTGQHEFINDNANGNHKCRFCGKTGAHVYIEDTTAEGAAVSPSTCTKGGTYRKSCSVCGAVSTAQKDIFDAAAKGHSMDNGICSNCGEYTAAVKTSDQYDLDNDGTKDEVYEISNAGQLYWFAGLVNGTLKDGTKQNRSADAVLTKDIVVNQELLTDCIAIDEETGKATVKDDKTVKDWTPVGTVSSAYKGTFDGQNHTISGLYFNERYQMNVGLIGYAGDGAVIKNVGVRDSYFYGASNVGGICGTNNNGLIENCYSESAISVLKEYAGGVCGYNYLNTIKNSYSVVNTGQDMVYGKCFGGVCGYNKFGYIRNCYYDNEKYTGDAVRNNSGCDLVKVEGKTTKQFASGEVAWLLQSEQTADAEGKIPQVWGQKLTGETAEETPVLGGKKVFRSFPCISYNNTKDIKKEHQFVADTEAEGAKISDATCNEPAKYGKSCSVCGEVSQSDIFTVGNKLLHFDENQDNICDICNEKYAYRISGFIYDVSGACLSSSYKWNDRKLANTTVDLEAPDLENFAFVGWYTYDASNDNQKHYKGDALCRTRLYSFTAKEDRVLVAVYKKKLKVTGIRFNDKVYDGKCYTYTGTPTWEDEWDNEENVPTEIIYEGIDNTYYSSTPPTDAGSYTATVSIPSDHANYAGKETFDFTIQKAQLTVRAKDKTIFKGEDVPKLDKPVNGTDYTISGLKKGDHFSEKLTMWYTADETGETTIRPNSVKTGTYTIFVSGPTKMNNYTVVYKTGTLQVKSRYKYRISVVNGTADASVSEQGKIVTLTAITVSSGMIFDRWIATENVKIADAGSAKTTFVMPAKNVTIVAIYKQRGTTAGETTPVISGGSIGFASQTPTVSTTPVISGGDNKESEVPKVSGTPAGGDSTGIETPAGSLPPIASEPPTAEDIQGSEPPIASESPTGETDTDQEQPKETPLESMVPNGSESPLESESPNDTTYPTESERPIGTPTPVVSGTFVPTDTPMETDTVKGTSVPVVLPSPTATANTIQGSDFVANAPGSFHQKGTTNTAVNVLALNAGLKVRQSGKKLKVSWGKMEKASGYLVYVQYANQKFGASPAKTVTSGKKTAVSVSKLNGKPLNPKKNYKVYVAVYRGTPDSKNVLGKSFDAYVAGVKNKKFTNAKKVKVSKKKVILQVGTTKKIKASVVYADRKKKLFSNYVEKLRYASSNENIATVTKNGRVKALKRGTCTIYVYAHNGFAKRVKVTVK